MNTLPGRDVGGRKRSITRKVMDALDIAREHMPQIIAKLTELAEAGDTQAAKLLLNYCYGQAPEHINIKADTNVNFVVAKGYGNTDS